MLFAGVFLVFLHTPPGRNLTVSLIETAVNRSVFNDGQLRIGALKGNLLRGVLLTDVRVVQSDGTLASIDSIGIRYRLLPLVGRHISVVEMDVADAGIALRRRRDRTWNVGSLLGTSEEASSGNTWQFSLDRGTIRRISFSGLQSGRREKLLWSADIPRGRATGIVFGADTLGLRVDTLRGGIRYPGRTDSVRFALAGKLTPAWFQLDTLLFASDASSAFGAGRIPFTLAPADSSRFDLSLSPLSFADLRAFLPHLDSTATLEGRLAVRSGNGETIGTGRLSGSDGMHLEHRTVITNDPDEGFDLHFDATLGALNPAWLTGNGELTGKFDAVAHLQVRGKTMESASGTGKIKLEPSEFRGQAIGRSHLDFTLSEGEMKIGHIASLAGGTMTGEATLRPFDTLPAYRAGLEIANLSLADVTQLFGVSEKSGVISGTLEVSGRGRDLRSAEIIAGGQFDRSRIESCHIEMARLEANVADAGITLSSSLLAKRADTLKTAPMSLKLRAGAGFDDTWQYEMDALEFRDIDLSCLSSGGGIPTSLTGYAAFAGTGLNLASMEVDGSVALGASGIGPVSVDTLVIEAALQDGRLQAEGRAGKQKGSVSAGLTASFDSGNHVWFEGTTDQLDLAELVPPSMQTLTITSAFSGELDAPPSVPMTGRYALALMPSTVHRQKLRSGSLEGQIDGDGFTFSGGLEMPDGGLRLNGAVQFSENRWTALLSEATFNNIHVGALSGWDAFRTSLNGKASFTAGVERDSAMTAGAKVQFEESLINDAVLTAATAVFDINDDQWNVEITGSTPTGSLYATARGNRGPGMSTRYESVGELTAIDLGSVTGIRQLAGPVNAAWAFAGNGDKIGSSSAEGSITMGPSELGSVQVESIILDIALESGTLYVRTFEANTNVAALSGDGSVALGRHSDGQSDFGFSGSILDLSPLAGLANADQLLGSGEIAGNVSGPSDRLRFVVSPRISHFILDEIRISNLNARISGEKSDQLTWELDVRTGFLANPVASLQSARVELQNRNVDTQLLADFIIDENRSLAIEGMIQSSDTGLTAHLKRMDLELGEDRWSLLQPAAADLQNPYRIQNFLLFSDDQQIAVDGIIDREGEQNLILTTENLRVAGFADLFGYEGLGGRLNTFLVLSGDAGSPEVSGGLELRNIVSRQRQVGSLAIEIAYADGRLDIDAALTGESGQRLTANGYLPANLKLSSVEAAASDVPARLAIETPGFPIGWLEPFIDPQLVSRIDGNLQADVLISGTQGNPELSGKASISSGRILLPEAAVPYSDIEINAGFDGTAIAIERAQLRSGNGTLSAEGSIDFITLTRQRYDIDASLKAFRAVETPTYQATIGGDVRLTGSSTSPVLEGTVVVGPANIFLTEELTSDELEPVRLSARDLQTLEARFGYRITEADTATFDFYEALTMEVNLEMGQNVWLRSAKNPDLDIEFDGQIRAEKAPQEDPLLFGTINVNPSRSTIRQYGRAFSIERGNLRFNGPYEETLVDMRAGYRAPSHKGNPGPKIMLDVTGRIDALDIEPSSEPAMETIDIVSYIATGRPADEGLFGGGAGLETQAADLAIGQLGMLVEGVAGDELGLDVIEIESDGLRGATLTVGKYVPVGDRYVFASLRQPINLSQGNETARATRDTEAVVEFHLLESLLVRLASRNRSPRFNLLYEFAY